MHELELTDKSMRRTMFENIGFNELSRTDPDCSIRISYYRTHGYDKRALSDSSETVRLEAYRALGYTQNALKDQSKDIRIEARSLLGYLEKDKHMKTDLNALRKYYFVADNAKSYFKIKENYTKVQLKAIMEAYRLENM